MKKFILFCSIIAVVFSQCKRDSVIPQPPKPNYNGGAYNVNGVVVLYDTLSGIYSYNTVSSIPVYLKYSTDATGYLYPTTSNSSGQYAFSGISGDSSYIVYARKDSNGVKYYGEFPYPKGSVTQNYRSDTIKLYPSQTNQNGIHLILFDSLGGRYPNTIAWVFTTPSSFNATTDSLGKSFDMTTNLYGVDNKLNIAPGNYYIRVIVKSGSTYLKGEDTDTVEASGIKTFPITLKTFTLNKNGFELLILDDNGTPVNNADIFTYRSRSVFAADTLFQDSSLVLHSDSIGKASQYNINEGWYYFRVRRQVGNTIFKGVDSVNVPADMIVRDTITIKQ